MNQEIDILLVEDNESDAEMTMRAIKKSHITCNVFHVHDGVEALHFLFSEGAYATRRSDIMPKVILLDLKMPKISGIEVLKKIKLDVRTKKIPVVVLTSSKEDPDIKQCYELGANGYVVKPEEYVRFSQAVAEVGLYWLVNNQPPV